jgi:hypothetical protein
MRQRPPPVFNIDAKEVLKVSHVIYSSVQSGMRQHPPPVFNIDANEVLKVSHVI